MHHDQAATLALTCPHCMVVSHISPQAVPHFSDLTAVRPRQIGLVYRCDACNSPIFVRHAVRSFTPARIELSPQFIEIERPAEKFSYTYLPEQVEIMFREALACYSHAALNAFVSMCRRTMQAVYAQAGEAGRLRIYDELNEVRDMAQIDADSFTAIKRVLFGTDADPAGPPILDEDRCALLLEIMKDLLYETYVRKGHLQQAMVVRRFFADEARGVKTAAANAEGHGG